MLELVLFFALLSLLSVGGMSAVMPEVQRVVVDVQHWATPEEFVQLLAIAQVAPGPNVLIVSLVGWKVHGLAGSLVALASMCAPAAALTWWVSDLWERFRDAEWRKALQRALAPLTVGLILAGGYVIATPSGLDWRSVLLAGGSALGSTLTRWNPLWLLVAGGVLGAFLF